jgi:anti-sigma B factor antagonist
MSLEANIQTDSQGNLTIHMRGGFDYESIQSLRKELNELTSDNPYSHITLDMNQVDFVGSTGIAHFVDTLNVLNSKKANIQMSNVKSEFVKVFKLYKMDALEAMISEFDNDETENLGQLFANRKHTFSN